MGRYTDAMPTGSARANGFYRGDIERVIKSIGKMGTSQELGLAIYKYKANPNLINTKELARQSLFIVEYFTYWELTTEERREIDSEYMANIK